MLIKSYALLRTWRDPSTYLEKSLRPWNQIQTFFFLIFEETPTKKLVGMKKFRAKQFIEDDFHNFDTALTAKGGIKLYCIEVYYVLN